MYYTSKNNNSNQTISTIGKIYIFFFSEMVEEEEDGKLDGLKDIKVGADEEVVDDTPADCCPDPCYAKFPFLAGDDESPFWQGWGTLRLKTFKLIENTYFETAVITMILLSSLALVRNIVNIYIHK